MKLLMFVFFFVYSTTFVSGQEIRKILIDANRNDPISLSGFAEKITPVILEKNEDYPFDCIDKVIWCDQYLFLTVFNSLDQEGFPQRTLQYDITGKFIRKIGHDDSQHITLANSCDTINHLLFCSYSGGTSCFDFDGNFIKSIPISIVYSTFIGNNFFWKGDTHWDAVSETMEYTLTRTDVSTLFKDTLYRYVEEPDGPIGRFASFSNNHNSMFVSFGLDSTIYQIQNHVLKPVAQFTIKPAPPMTVDRYGYSFQGFIGRFLFINYSNNMTPHYFILDTKNQKEYGFRILRKGKWDLEGGVIDDWFGTGFWRIFPLNRPGYCYYYQQAECTKGKIEGVDDSNIVLYLIKTKP